MNYKTCFYSLYGLKQAGRNWRFMLLEFLESVGFIALKADMCIFTRVISVISNMFIVVWVDDILTFFRLNDHKQFDEH